jgi:quinol monooxygenase YgiN
MIVILGQIDVHPEDVKTAADLMRTMAAASSNEPGCLLYAYAADVSMPNRFQLSEWWQDDAALSSHFRTEHMAVYRSSLGKLRVQNRTVKRFEVASVTDLVVPAH